MSENKTTYESLDGKIAPEALLKDTRGKLQMVDGHGIKQEADYDDPDKLYGMLIARIQKYHPSADVTQIEKAYNLAKKAHGDQKRKSGEPYIIHPLWVAIILADLEMDKETITAALLHDVVEDTQIWRGLYQRRVWRRGSSSGRRCYETWPCSLFCGQTGTSGGEFEKDVPCYGKGYPGYYH